MMREEHSINWYTFVSQMLHTVSCEIVDDTGDMFPSQLALPVCGESACITVFVEDLLDEALRESPDPSDTQSAATVFRDVMANIEPKSVVHEIVNDFIGKLQK